MRRKATNEQFTKIQKEIKESSLADYTSWVQEWEKEISDAEGIGDTRGIYNGVKALARKRSKPPTNLTTDRDGNVLKCAEDVAATWHQFLKSKFAATPAERNRPHMDQLPCTKGKHALSNAQFKQDLHKMNTGKAVGPDQIPTKLYLHSTTCQRLLRQLI